MFSKGTILLIHQGAIGDLILSLPAFYALHNAFPGARFEVMGYPAILSLIHKRFYADHISSIDRAEVASLYHEESELQTHFVNYFKKFDNLFIFGSTSQEVVVDTIARIKGPAVYHIKTFPEDNDAHIIDFQADQIAALGFTVASRVPEIFLLEADTNQAQQFLQSQSLHSTSNPLIAIHPGSGSRQKNWPAAQYISLIKNLYRELDGTFIMVEGPADGDVVNYIRGELRETPMLLLQNLDLRLLASIVKQCSVYIGNDSGITHVAAALGVPVIAIFGPTDPRVWGPRGKHVNILRDIMPGSKDWRWVEYGEAVTSALRALYYA
ncbi:MAG: glycosyltransferase family 9 protein [Proteobacteria bacterium]|nr:glycosyltransferase family 9 protein [Pseudomonadota bacterium]